jgi:hypothetical protein
MFISILLSSMALVSATPLPQSTTALKYDIPRNSKGKFNVMHANGQGWCLKGNNLHLCDTPTSFSIYTSELTYDADEGFYNIIDSTSMTCLRHANYLLYADAYSPGIMKGYVYDFAWRFEPAHGGYIVRNAMGGAPFPNVIGYDASGKDPRQMLVANTDAKMQIWYVKAAA